MPRVKTLLTLCLMLLCANLTSQTFLNGNFEINTAGTTNRINLSNAVFNSYMSNVTGHGTVGNLDIITTAQYHGGPQSGNWFISLTGGGTDLVAMELSTGLVAGRSYTISYYEKSDQNYTPFPFQFGHSTTNTSFGNTIYTAPSAPTAGTWKQRTFTFTATHTGRYIMIQGSTGTTSWWAHIDNIKFDCNISSHLGNDTTMCAGDTIHFNMVDSGATYLWYDGTTDSTAYVTQPGTYWVKITKPGCSLNDTVVIGNSPVYALDLGPDTTLCDGDTLPLDVTTPNATYLWHNNGSTATFDITQAGTYWVEVSIGKCNKRDSVVIQYNPNPVFNLGPDTTLCPWEFLLLDATTLGATYSWKNGSVMPTQLIGSAGTYSVEVTVNGCSVSDTVDVLYNPPYSVDLGPDTAICTGDNLVLDVTNPGATYLWNNNSLASTFLVTQAGTYHVTVSDGRCQYQDTVQITNIALPPVNLGNDTALCAGDSLLLQVGRPHANYQWQNATTQPQWMVKQAGLYWVEVTDTQTTCHSRDSIVIQYNPYPVVNLGKDTTLCYRESLLLDVTRANAQYRWQDLSTGSQLTARYSGWYWVDVTVNKCRTRDSLKIDLSPLRTISLGPDLSLCQNEQYTLDATTPNATYTWQDLSTQPTFTVTQAGTYWAKVQVDHCEASDTVVVSYRPLPAVNLGPDTTLCFGDQLLLDVTLPNATYRWQDQSTLPSILVSKSGFYWVEVTEDGCTNSDSIRVAENRLKYLHLGKDTTICAGDALLLNATTLHASYRWQDQSVGATLLTQDEGWYWVELKVDHCTLTDSIHVAHREKDEIYLGSDTSLCFGSTLMLNAGLPYSTYLWQDGSIDSSYEVSQEGFYEVEVLTPCGPVAAHIQIDYHNCDCSLYMPNSFTPNFDGINESYAPVMYCPLVSYHFRIYDRWGIQVFETSDPAQAWDGQVKGEPAPIGAYSYTVTYHPEGRGEQVEIGIVHLVR